MNRIFRWIVILFSILLAAGCSSPTTPTGPVPEALKSDLLGRWQGELLVLDTNFEIVIYFEEDVDGQVQGWINIPQQGVTNLSLAEIEVTPDGIRFEMPSNLPTAVFEGQLGDDGSLSGEYRQMGYKGSFSVARREAPAETPPVTVELPYIEEEVWIENGPVGLAGTLSLPETDGPHPAVIMISGSGLQDRNNAHPSLPGYEPFRWLADHLTRQGIAVMRYDDRGAGASTGGEQGADTTLDYSYDTEAVLDYLLQRSDLNPQQIGLLGHSEGAHIAALVAARRPEVGFVISMAGMAVDGNSLITLQLVQGDRADGYSEEEIARRLDSNRIEIDLILAQDWEGLRAYLTGETEKYFRSLPEEQRESGEQLDQAVQDLVDMNMRSMQGWLYYFLTSNPAREWEHVQAPVLALFGGKDVQVDTGQNRPPMEEALRRGGNEDVTVIVFPTANHLFQEAGSGGPGEYARLPLEFVPDFLETITGWLLAHVDVR